MLSELSAQIMLDLSKDEKAFSTEEREVFRKLAYKYGNGSLDNGEVRPEQNTKRRRRRRLR